MNKEEEQVKDLKSQVTTAVASVKLGEVSDSRSAMVYRSNYDTGYEETITMLVSERVMNEQYKGTPIYQTALELAMIAVEKKAHLFQRHLTLVSTVRKAVHSPMFGIGEKMLDIKNLEFKPNFPYWQVTVRFNPKKQTRRGKK